jgi:F420-dependent methylenetetrahydromethanopterin dehydrogenase
MQQYAKIFINGSFYQSDGKPAAAIAASADGLIAKTAKTKEEVVDLSSQADTVICLFLKIATTIPPPERGRSLSWI